jgi:methionyl-tRNA formyltransferase
MLNLVYMGTAPFAVPCLEGVVAAGHSVRAVVSQPDRPHGRGMKLQPTPVKAAAQALGLPVLQPERASAGEFVEKLRELAPDAIVVVAYGQILRQRVLDVPRLGCINVHGSLLPELRGAAPIQWAIIRGLAETGVTTMFMDRGMDTGDMLLRSATPIAPDDTAGTLAERLAHLGRGLLVETLARLEAGTLTREPQDPERATYAPMLAREDAQIQWERPAAEARNLIHGCNPAPGAYTHRGGALVKVWRAEALAQSPGAAPGTVLDGEGLLVACGDGALRLLEVQPEARGRMEGGAFRNGYGVRAGEVWGSGR